MARLIVREQNESVSVNETDFATNIDSYLDNLFDKSSVVKAHAMEQWNLYLLQNCDYRLVNDHASNLVDSCIKSISRGDIVEQACDLLNTLCILLAENGSTYFADAMTALNNSLSFEETSPLHKSKLVKTLSLVSFIWNAETADQTVEVVSRLNDIIDSLCTETNLPADESSLLVTSLHLWTFLLTIVEDDHVLSFVLEEDILSCIGDVIRNSNDYPTVYAAGKALGYISQVLQQTSNDFDISHYDYNVELPEVIDSLRKTKKPKKYTGIDLEQIANSLENGSTPLLEITVNDRELTFDDWTKIAQIDILRSVTQSAFLTHLSSNTLFSTLLELDLSTDSHRKPKGEKKMTTERHALNKKK